MRLPSSLQLSAGFRDPFNYGLFIASFFLVAVLPEIFY